MIPGPGRSPGEGNGNPLQYYCLGNPMERGAWWAIIHGVTKELDMTSTTKQQQQQNAFYYFNEATVPMSFKELSIIYDFISLHWFLNGFATYELAEARLIYLSTKHQGRLFFNILPINSKIKNV